MAYQADKGGVFASDTHRRVLGHLPLPGDEPNPLTPLAYRLSEDRHHQLQHVDELAEVLADLEGDGYAASSEEGWAMTDEGLDALNAPLPEEPTGPVRPALLGGLTSNGTEGS